MNSPFTFGKGGADEAFVNGTQEIYRLKQNFLNGITRILRLGVKVT